MANSFRISESTSITVSESGSYSLHFDSGREISFALIIRHQGEMDLRLNCSFERDSNVRMVLVNQNEGYLKLEDEYQIPADCDIRIASCHLQSEGCAVNSDYHLTGQGSELLVQGAILADHNKTFNLNTFHQAQHTKAQINSFGVVVGTGKCEMIVKNSIGKGMKQSETHQTTRLLTYDKTAVGKILPILYIDENDVAASHAASLGQPDESQLFYMQTRGLSRNEALELITVGYLQPVTQMIDDEQLNALLKDEIEQKVKQCLTS